MEPWYVICKAVAIPPAKFWFNWRFEGLDLIPASGPAIVAANHISYLDPFANGYAVMKAGRRPRFLAKDDLFKIPVVGTAIRGAGQIPVDRGAGGAAPLRLGRERRSSEGEVVVIYPEGTVTKHPDSLPMDGKTGAVRLSLMSGVPDHADGELGRTGGVAEVGEGLAEVRPPDLGQGRASRSTSARAPARWTTARRSTR